MSQRCSLVGGMTNLSQECQAAAGIWCALQLVLVHFSYTARTLVAAWRFELS